MTDASLPPARIADVIQRLDVDEQTAMRMLVNRLAVDRGLEPPWDTPDTADLPVPEDVATLGAAHEILLARADGRHKQQGSYYTPAALVDTTLRFSIAPQLDTLATPERPTGALQIIACDPACGAGAFLAPALRMIASRYVSLISGEPDPPEWAIRMVSGEIAYECIFGMDIDPIAVDLAKAAVWLVGGGLWGISLLDRNIAVCNPLEGEEPPHLTERLAERSVVDLGEDG